ncbi:MAG: PEP-CTERM sorting domain-containing protein, partial [Planctomycetaceae bacterium]
FANGWSMGETGFFGFCFDQNGQRHYGWGELKLDPTSANTNGYGFQITRAYYNDTPGAPIAAGDTGGGGAVPEPSTFALGLLAAGGVAAYRSRRKQPAA